MDVSFVVAVAENGIIGNDNELPWRLSSDLKRFRQITMGKPIIMGRNTFNSIGKPLDGRANIILSRNKDFSHDGIFVVQDVPSALELGKREAEKSSCSEIMIIGGAQIYSAFMPFATRIYYTQVHSQPDGDASFPSLDLDVWEEVERDFVKAGPKDSSDVTNILYQKRL